MHRRGICDCSSICPSGPACSSHWNCNGWAHTLGAAAWVVQGKHTENTLCPLCAAITHLHWHAPQPAHVSKPGWSLEERLLQETFPEQTGCSQGSPCGVAGVRRERSPSLPADFPAPSPGTKPASCLVPFPPQQTVTCCQALSCMIRENKYPLHSPLLFCFVFHSFSGLK